MDRALRIFRRFSVIPNGYAVYKWDMENFICKFREKQIIDMSWGNVKHFTTYFLLQIDPHTVCDYYSILSLLLSNSTYQFTTNSINQCENYIKLNFSSLSPEFLTTILESTARTLSKNHQVTPELLEELVKYSKSYLENNPNPKIAYSISKFLQALPSHQISKLKKYFPLNFNLTPSYLSSLSLSDLSYIHALYTPNKQKQTFLLHLSPSPQMFSDFSCSFISSSLTKLSQFNTSHAIDWYFILKYHLLCNSSSETTIKNIEKILIPIINGLSENSLINLMFTYQHRKTQDIDYLMNTFWKSVYECLLYNFDKYNIKYLELILKNYAVSSQMYGNYCDERIIEKVTNILKNYPHPELSNMTSKVQFLTNVFIFAYNLQFLDKNIFEMIHKGLLPQFSNMKIDDLITVSVYYSRLNESPIKFWKKFQSRVKEISNGKIENYSKLYNALLNLKLNSPEVYNRIIGTFDPKMLEKAESEWKKYRKSEVKKDYKTNIQKVAEEVLDEVKMVYEAEYYDEYNIDLAIVEKRIAFELCGPSHYIWPSMKLNGKSAQKINNLQKKGWKVCLIKFVYGQRDVVSEEIRKNILSFLNEQGCC